jgi:hypothetical protein
MGRETQLLLPWDMVFSAKEVNPQSGESARNFSRRRHPKWRGCGRAQNHGLRAGKDLERSLTFLYDFSTR